jgi:hypothetical protein
MTGDENYVSCFGGSLGLDQDCNRILVNEMKMLAYDERKIENKAFPIIQQAVNIDPELTIVFQVQLTAVMYLMYNAIV